jgi:DNA helicase-2/ATP-dependent DNA helicase PcrA
VILDEAQDTAKSVFEVLRLLITQKHGFCAIGDIEQCLFGFAGCSPENLIAYANERGCHILTLHETFRFGPTIASLANRVVDDMDIEKRFKISTTTSQDSAPIASYPVEDPKLPQQQVLDIVNSWRNRGIPLSSMAVLCRTNKELSEYMALLNANGIACQNKGLSMLNRLEVKHMLSAVSLIQNNNLDDWITIINQYAIGVDSVTMSAVFEGFTGSLTQMKAHMAAKPIVGVGPGRINVISSMVDKILTMKRLIDAGEKDFYKLAEVINIRETKFIKTARLNAEGQSLAEERLEFLGVLTRLAKEYGPNIYGFREYLQTLMDYDGSDQHTRQAVNLLTVHKSKGMTLPYTILDTKRFFTMLDHPQAHLWEQFCLYVGITRAKYELHLFYDPNQPTAEYIVEDPLVRRQIRNQRLERESQAVASPLEQLKMMELGSGTVPIDIERLIHPTNNAVLVQVNGRETWIPKKALRVRGDHVFVSLWKAKELGLR